MPAPASTTCVIAGGGPAGMVLGLLLARGGVPVVVMEKHADFLRDFRGDTVHASTLRLLDELGLGQRFEQVPHRVVEDITMAVQGVPIGISLRRLPGRHKHIALVPQWDFLELLATAAEAEPTFTLMRNTEVLGPLLRDGRVTGVSYRDADGHTREMHAVLTVACDGRSSTLRSSMRLATHSFGAPMDVWWFRLPRRSSDPKGLNGVFRSGHACIVIDRGDYYQIAYIIPKGTDSAMRAAGIDALHRQLVALVPWLSDRVDQLVWDDVKLLDVQLNRLRRWYTDGLLLIGDAAHAMSPVGGVGINLAVADAVAAAAALAGPLRAGDLKTSRLARVQARRWLPTWMIQSVQRIVHARVIAQAMSEDSGDDASKAPLPVRIISKMPGLGVVAGYAVGIGPFPEHAPAFARR